MRIKCDRWVQIPNGNPEPDQPEDLYDIVECGGDIKVIYRNGEEAGWECEMGHHFISEDYKTDMERYEEFLEDMENS